MRNFADDNWESRIRLETDKMRMQRDWPDLQVDKQGLDEV